ncbi:13472_t:CDS:2 [Cetraspora pellucida]|uniref:13472_t:CDS:1 n=1 Tax=Cetraspora pellucida TaxID=1433469 RepID=A0A9N8Z5J8_9GLOM|nr:13472_t:CDS:2 [Cetraspora pellucida]
MLLYALIIEIAILMLYNNNIKNAVSSVMPAGGWVEGRRVLLWASPADV